MDIPNSGCYVGSKLFTNYIKNTRIGMKMTGEINWDAIQTIVIIISLTFNVANLVKNWWRTRKEKMQEVSMLEDLYHIEKELGRLGTLRTYRSEETFVEWVERRYPPPEQPPVGTPSSGHNYRMSAKKVSTAIRT